MNKHGQSMIEYALIAVLVVLGILIMGPYVLRSINAHFKLWDEGVYDSFTEKLTQAAPFTLPVKCVCNNNPEGCGGSPCFLNQRLIQFSCTPQWCNGAPSSSCNTDSSCCTTLTPQGCGTYPCPSTGCSGAPLTPQPANSSAPDNCYYGQEMESQLCGSNQTITCIYNPNCAPMCEGVLSPGAYYCADLPAQSNVQPPNLLQDYGIIYVPVCANQSPCAVYCGAGYVLNASHTACINSFVVAAAPSAGPYSSPTVVSNDQSFGPMCAYTQTLPTPSSASTDNSSSIILSVTVVADPQDQETHSPLKVSGDGCQNPGEPSDMCKIDFKF